MRYITLLIFIITFTCRAEQTFAQGTNHPFYTSGNKILDPCGNEFVPKGVNYSLADDWDFPGNMNNGELSSEIIKANPNTVRIEWYASYPSAGRPAYTVADLDSVVSRFNRAGIVSIIELHDLTGSDAYTPFNNVILPWWTSAEVKSLLQKHKTHVMLNFANEFGIVNWAANPATAYTAWVNHYINAITTVRNAGIDVPVIIDAPEYGTSIDVALMAGQALVSSDPLQRVIMSVHAYWYQKSPADMQIAGNDMAGATFPTIFGEIANVQDANGNCSDAIPAYTDLLQVCEAKKVGWLAWTWTNDNCGPRQMTSDGSFANLNVYGSMIINNANFGLAGHADKSCFFKTKVEKINNIKQIKVYPNPTTTGKFIAESDTDGRLYLYNLQGQVVGEYIIGSGMNEIHAESLASGTYFGKFVSKGDGPVYSFRLIDEH